jgi:hypothetical protein
VGEKDFKPKARSGHSSAVFNNKMYIFGGILELTHELNDLIVFDFETKKFSSNSETHEEGEHLANMDNGGHSPTQGKEKTLTSPMKRKTISHAHSNISPSRSPQKKRQVSPSTIKKDETTGGKNDGLSSPTSVSMQNSFIIKNADESFEINHKLLPKNKMKATSMSETVKFTTFVEGNKPTPRDGHSACIDSLGFMYIFGGDRHHMPFNDLYMIKLE